MATWISLRMTYLGLHARRADQICSGLFASSEPPHRKAYSFTPNIPVIESLDQTQGHVANDALNEFVER
jgi:hypothetical protein